MTIKFASGSSVVAAPGLFGSVPQLAPYKLLCILLNHWLISGKNPEEGLPETGLGRMHDGSLPAHQLDHQFGISLATRKL